MTPKPGAEGLSALPKDYASVPKQVPQLGPPLPGDFGRPILRQQQAGNGAVPPVADPLRATAEQEADLALSSKVFFAITGRGAGGSAVAAPSVAAPGGESAGRVGAGDPAFAQNMQDEKVAFLGADDSATRSAHRVQRRRSPDTLDAGTIVEAALLGGIKSDLPGFVRAQVTANVFDSARGCAAWCRMGSILLGRYDSQVAFGQERAQAVMTRLLRSDGTSIVLDRLPASDIEGYAGLEDEVDHRWGRIAGAALVSTVLGVGTELGAGDSDRLVEALRRGTQDTASQAGQQLVRRNMNVQPTLTARPGLPLRPGADQGRRAATGTLATKETGDAAAESWTGPR